MATNLPTKSPATTQQITRVICVHLIFIFIRLCASLCTWEARADARRRPKAGTQRICRFSSFGHPAGDAIALMSWGLVWVNKFLAAPAAPGLLKIFLYCFRFTAYLFPLNSGQFRKQNTSSTHAKRLHHPILGDKAAQAAL